MTLIHKKRKDKHLTFPSTDSLLSNDLCDALPPALVIHGTDDKDTFCSQELCSHEGPKPETHACQLSELETQRLTEAL